MSQMILEDYRYTQVMYTSDRTLYSVRSFIRPGNGSPSATNVVVVVVVVVVVDDVIRFSIP